jgi:hypothetical protein
MHGVAVQGYACSAVAKLPAMTFEPMDPSATFFHRTIRIRSTSTAQQRSLDYEARNRVLPLRDTRIKI